MPRKHAKKNPVAAIPASTQPTQAVGLKPGWSPYAYPIDSAWVYSVRLIDPEGLCSKEYKLTVSNDGTKKRRDIGFLTRLDLESYKTDICITNLSPSGYSGSIVEKRTKFPSSRALIRNEGAVTTLHPQYALFGENIGARDEAIIFTYQSKTSSEDCSIICRYTLTATRLFRGETAIQNGQVFPHGKGVEIMHQPSKGEPEPSYWLRLEGSWIYGKLNGHIRTFDACGTYSGFYRDDTQVGYIKKVSSTGVTTYSQAFGDRTYSFYQVLNQITWKMTVNGQEVPIHIFLQALYENRAFPYLNKIVKLLSDRSLFISHNLLKEDSQYWLGVFAPQVLLNFDDGSEVAKFSLYENWGITEYAELFSLFINEYAHLESAALLQEARTIHAILTASSVEDEMIRYFQYHSIPFKQHTKAKNFHKTMHQNQVALIESIGFSQTIFRISLMYLDLDQAKSPANIIFIKLMELLEARNILLEQITTEITTLEEFEEPHYRELIEEGRKNTLLHKLGPIVLNSCNSYKVNLSRQHAEFLKMAAPYFRYIYGSWVKLEKLGQEYVKLQDDYFAQQALILNQRKKEQALRQQRMQQFEVEQDRARQSLINQLQLMFTQLILEFNAVFLGFTLSTKKSVLAADLFTKEIYSTKEAFFKSSIRTILSIKGTFFSGESTSPPAAKQFGHSPLPLANIACYKPRIPESEFVCFVNKNTVEQLFHARILFALQRNGKILSAPDKKLLDSGMRIGELLPPENKFLYCKIIKRAEFYASGLLFYLQGMRLGKTEFIVHFACEANLEQWIEPDNLLNTLERKGISKSKTWDVLYQLMIHICKQYNIPIHGQDSSTPNIEALESDFLHNPNWKSTNLTLGRKAEWWHDLELSARNGLENLFAKALVAPKGSANEVQKTNLRMPLC
jgi:hypothetical protein